MDLFISCCCPNGVVVGVVVSVVGVDVLLLRFGRYLVVLLSSLSDEKQKSCVRVHSTTLSLAV